MEYLPGGSFGWVSEQCDEFNLSVVHVYEPRAALFRLPLNI